MLLHLFDVILDYGELLLHLCDVILMLIKDNIKGTLAQNNAHVFFGPIPQRIMDTKYFHLKIIYDKRVV